MPKRATLRPLKSDKSGFPWMINIPGRFSESGKRERRYFKKKVEAEAFGTQQRIRIENFGVAGVSGAEMSGAQREAAAAAFRLLGNSPPQTLVDIVQRHLDNENQKNKSITLAELFVRFQAHLERKKRKGRPISVSYKRQVKFTAPRFSSLRGRIISEITSSDLLGAVEGVPSSARNALLRVVRAAFNFAIMHQWATKNPVGRGVMEDTGDKRVEVFTNRQVCRLIVAARRTRPQLLPYHFFGLFAGIRPDELLRLKWEHLQLAEKVIHLPAEITKTGFERYVELEPNLISWISWYEQKYGRQKGLITAVRNLRSHLRAIRRKARVTKWIQDGMRHTYASNWMALHKDENRCRDNMGHRTKDELQRHYRKHLPLKQAKAFWALVPNGRTRQNKVTPIPKQRAA